MLTTGAPTWSHQPVIDLENALSTHDIADLLHVTKLTVIRWARSGRLPAVQLPDKRWVTDRRHLNAFAATLQA